MIAWDANFLRRVLDSAPEGVVICQARGADHPVVYANPAFLRMCGYTIEELRGSDLRRLQQNDVDQPARAQLKSAAQSGVSARALLRNYRKDGAQFWNEVLIEPLRDASGAVAYYAGYYRDVSEREATGPARPAAGLPSWMREDRLSGLCSRAYFEELLRHDWLIARREARPLTLMLFDIDALGAYNDTFGRAAGDACIRRVSGIVAAAFRRGTDLVARWEGGTVCALVRGGEASGGASFARSVAQRVHNQHIHHPRSPRHKFVTMSSASVNTVPDEHTEAEQFMSTALDELRKARTAAGHAPAAESNKEVTTD